MTGTTDHIAKCLHCGRIRRFRSADAAAHARPYGRICSARVRLAAIAEAVKGFAAAQVDKARELIADGGIIATNRPGVFRAVSSKGDETYLTMASGHCGCPHGVRVTSALARPCYHVLSAKILVASGKAA